MQGDDLELLDEFCPDCGARRFALFRWCRACGLDFDDLDARGELPGGPYSPPRVDDATTASGRPIAEASTLAAIGRADTRRRAPSRSLARYLPVGIAAVLGIAFVGALASGLGGTVASAVDSAAQGLIPAAAPAPDGPGATAGVAGLTGTPGPTPTPPLAPVGVTTNATVTRIVDGDTIIAAIGDVQYRVRYIGIDAPESVNLDRPVEAMALEATDANRRLVSSATVVLERDRSETDEHGQLLRNVWVMHDGQLTMVGLELVRAGLARTSTFSDDVRYQAELVKAQASARDAALGIWGQRAPVAQGPQPAPAETNLPRLVGSEPIVVYGSRFSSVQGSAGVYTWRSVTFQDPGTIVRWDARSPVLTDCRLEWRVQPANAAGWGRVVSVPPKDRTSGSETVTSPVGAAALVVTSTCPDWHLSFQGTEAP